MLNMTSNLPARAELPRSRPQARAAQASPVAWLRHLGRCEGEQRSANAACGPAGHASLCPSLQCGSGASLPVPCNVLRMRHVDWAARPVSPPNKRVCWAKLGQLSAKRGGVRCSQVVSHSATTVSQSHFGPGFGRRNHIQVHVQSQDG